MLFLADGTQNTAYALMEYGGDEIALSDICESYPVALALRRAREKHQPHRDQVKIVPVIITVTATA